MEEVDVTLAAVVSPFTDSDGEAEPVDGNASGARKERGAYYTPEAVVSTLLRWAVRDRADRLLDPSCGDGRFIVGHANSVGVEQDAAAAVLAETRAPQAKVHTAEFFSWAEEARERFDCAAGNPPFIRYQRFRGDVRGKALALCARLGAHFSGLTSSWAPFLVVAASLLRRGGRMAFVTPAEIGHAPYAVPLLEYLVRHFDYVHIIAVRSKLFPDLSEDCWLLYAEGFSGSTNEILFSAFETFSPTDRPPSEAKRISVSEWRSLWNCRLRPFLLPEKARTLYQIAAFDPMSGRLGQSASIGIGYVSGANDFFHLRPSQAERLRIPSDLLRPSVRNGRSLPSQNLTVATVGAWRRSDEPFLLLRLGKTHDVPSSVRAYLDSAEGLRAREAYKCRVRSPWYSVPGVETPDFFLTYMAGLSPSLVRNVAGCAGANSVHCVKLRDKSNIRHLTKAWRTAFTQLSAEIEGHPLGGGMLKLEPGEASQILIPPRSLWPTLDGPEIRDAIRVMRRWRHYAHDA